MQKNVLISVGPIPARLDSVKFITNRFKGGLAIKTANFLKSKGLNVTAVAWKYTDVTGLDSDIEVIRVLDVYEYYEYFKKHANEADACVMAAAVANLSPTNPYEDKFPSHMYKEGDKFNIEFEIAPRAIDIIKKVNPRCCLIGYKLFDAKTDEELVGIARHTLHDSKANIIFANTPADAKKRKLALFQDNTVLEMTFDEHLELMYEAITQKYFKTRVESNIFDDVSTGKMNRIMLCKKLVKKFESTLTDNYGTIAIKVSKDGDFVTTSRGHKGEPVYVKRVDTVKKEIIAEAKATLNVPALVAFIERGYEYVIHRHNTSYLGPSKNGSDIVFAENYIFPGTIGECTTTREALNMNNINCIMQKGHGYIAGFRPADLDWNDYYHIFKNRYVEYPMEMEKAIVQVDEEDWLDVGCNKKTNAKYICDPYVTIDNPGVVNVDYETNERKFKLITLKNSINYLKQSELDKLISWLKPGGMLMANTFVQAPNYRLKDGEAVYLEDGVIHHYLIVSEEEVYKHQFNQLNFEKLKDDGFVISKYNNEKSALVVFFKKE